MLDLRSVVLDLNSCRTLLDEFIGNPFYENAVLRLKSNISTKTIDAFVVGTCVGDGAFGGNTSKKISVLTSLEGSTNTDFDLSMPLKLFVDSLVDTANEVRITYNYGNTDDIVIQNIVVEKKIIKTEQLNLNSGKRCKVVLD